MLPMLAMLSEWHVILALIIVFLLFGGRKLPELARGIGEAIKEFKKSQREIVPDDTHRQAAVPGPAPIESAPSVSATPASPVTPQPATPNTSQKTADPKAG